MFGHLRKLERTIWSNLSELRALERLCDGQHIHLVTAGCSRSGRSRALSSDSVGYRNLSNAWAECVLAFAKRRGLRSEPVVFEDVLPSHSRQCAVVNKAVLGNLPRGKIIPPLMTDFLISQEHVIPPDVSLREIALGGRLPDNKFFLRVRG